MSEQEPEFQPGVVRPVWVDPEVATVLYHAKLVQRLLDTMPDADQDFVHDKAVMLNKMWGRTNALMDVSGKIYTDTFDGIEHGDFQQGKVRVLATSTGEEIEYTAQGEQMVSQGFGIIPEGRVMFHGEDIGQRYAVKLLFDREVVVGGDSDDDDELPELHEVTWVADPDDVHFDLGYDSDGFVYHMVHEYFNDSVNEMYEKLDDCDSVIERLMALRGLRIPCPRYITEREQVALERFMNDMLAADSEPLPFLLNVHDRPPTYKPGEPTEIVGTLAKERQLVTLHGVEVQAVVAGFRQYDDDNGKTHCVPPHIVPGNFEIRLLLRDYKKNQDDDTDVISLRLDDVDNLTSVRDFFLDT